MVLSALLLVESHSNGKPAAAPEAAKPPAEEGIPVTDPVVLAKCGGCHTKDAKGNLSRISWERATPEGWEEAHQADGPSEWRHA